MPTLVSLKLPRGFQIILKENLPKFLKWYTQVTQMVFKILTKAMNVSLNFYPKAYVELKVGVKA
jgi:hypothetical protein